MRFEGLSNHYLKLGPVNWSTFSAKYYVIKGVQWSDGYEHSVFVVRINISNGTQP